MYCCGNLSLFKFVCKQFPAGSRCAYPFTVSSQSSNLTYTPLPFGLHRLPYTQGEVGYAITNPTSELWLLVENGCVVRLTQRLHFVS